MCEEVYGSAIYDESVVISCYVCCPFRGSLSSTIVLERTGIILTNILSVEMLGVVLSCLAGFRLTAFSRFYG